MSILPSNDSAQRPNAQRWLLCLAPTPPLTDASRSEKVPFAMFVESGRLGRVHIVE